MNKTELVAHIASDLEVPKAQAEKLLNSFTDAVFKNVRKEGVKLTGFGTFSAAKRQARTGRNPQTGEEIKIPERWVPVFKAGASLKDAAERSR